MFLIKAKLKNLQNEYDAILADMPDYKIFSFKEYCEKRSMAESRCFQMEINGDKTVAMVSFADMINHSPNPNVTNKYCKTQEGFKMEATRKIKKG